ncbi:MAG: GntR family transcriptional regulator [Bacilli bacterium]|nr:GntR family transcriptional regulator [Bacilli bacterium]
MKFVGADPIYIQIANYIKKLIENNVFSDGSILPSVRDFGMANGVNPNTVARAYDLLIEEGVIVSIPKKGYFVKESEDADKDINELERRIDSLFRDGFTKEDILTALEKRGK